MFVHKAAMFAALDRASRPVVEGLEARQLFCADVHAFGDPAAHDASQDLSVMSASAAAAGTTFRVNAGGSSYTDAQGQVWAAGDNASTTGFSGGTSSSYTIAVADTTDDRLYYDRRWGADFGFNRSVANGNYTLRLHFVEPVMSGANQRVFSVAAEGRTIISNLDLHAEAGARAAVVKSFDVSVNDGTLNLRLFSTKDNAIISGIELVPARTEAIFRVNAGGTTYTDAQSHVWAAGNNASNTGFSGGTSSSYVTAVGGTTDDRLYYDRRWGADFGFNRSVANGNYTLRLHFVEPVMSGANQRVFSVAAEGRTIISNLDLHAEAGARTAVVKSFDLAVNDGTLNLRLFSTKDNAIISGIELVPQDSESPQFTEIQWSDRNAASPVTRSEALKGVVDGKLYVFGGFSGSAGPIVRSDVYDPKTNGWTRIADLPARITHVGVAVVGRDIYFAGAYTGLKATGYDQSFATRNVWKYNVDSNTFTSVTPLPEARGSGALVYTDGALHFFGGVDTSRRDRGEHWMMKLDGSNTWVAKAVNPDPRSHMGYAALDGKVYAIGGQHNTDANLTTRTTVQAYDPATNKWTDLAGMSRGISHIGSSTFAMGARLIVVGGEYAHLKGVADVQAYDPRANAWTQLTALPFTNNSTVADVIDGYIYNTTGSRQSMYVGKPVA